MLVCARGRSEEHTSELQSHRDLHSFPTRRSSDLKRSLSVKALHTVTAVIELGAGLALLGWPSATVALLVRVPLEAPAALTVARVGGAGLLALGVACWFARGEDRKSTRLNSSHTEIYTLSLHDALPISNVPCP